MEQKNEARKKKISEFGMPFSELQTGLYTTLLSESAVIFHKLNSLNIIVILDYIVCLLGLCGP